MGETSVNMGESEESIELISRNGSIPPVDKPPSHPEITLDFCNKRTKSFVNENTGTKKFMFDYTGTAFKNSIFEKKSSWKVLEDLLTEKKMNVIRTPFILNYVNQKLDDCAWFYALHVFAALIIFIFLSIYIISRQLWNQTFLLFVVGICSLFLIFKGCIKSTIGKRETFSFYMSYSVNICTHFLTIAFLLAPLYYSYDNEDTAWKQFVLWFLPIIASLSAWLNLLYVFRKSPFGIYVLMMQRIFKSFASISVIWIPTLITFSFAFLLVMEGSITPWLSLNQKIMNGTVEASHLESVFAVFQAIVKTSSMMLGEVDANDILDTKKWIASTLVLIFEVFTIIILMNLMLSLAVDDVKELMQEAEGEILKIKVKFLIEVLQIYEAWGDWFIKTKWISRTFPFLTVSFHTKSPQNVLVLTTDNNYGYSNDQSENVEWDIIPDEIAVSHSSSFWNSLRSWLIGLNLNEYLKD